MIVNGVDYNIVGVKAVNNTAKLRLYPDMDGQAIEATISIKELNVILTKLKGVN